MWVPESLHSIWRRCLLSVTRWTNDASLRKFHELKMLGAWEAPCVAAQHLPFSRRLLTLLRRGYSAASTQAWRLMFPTDAIRASRWHIKVVVGATSVYLVPLPDVLSSVFIAYNHAHCGISDLH